MLGKRVIKFERLKIGQILRVDKTVFSAWSLHVVTPVVVYAKTDCLNKSEAHVIC